MNQFKTIRQIAKTGIISEYYLRQLVACGDCPGIRSGNRFLVNEKALEELLDEMSRNKWMERTNTGEQLQ